MAWELMNTHPFEDIEATRSELDKLWDTFFFGTSQPEAFLKEMGWCPAVDVAETKDAIVVEVEIPGVNPKDMNITLSGRTLTLNGEKKESKEEKEENYHLIERDYGTFTRAVSLPGEVEEEKIKASYQNGILKITLPKSGKKKKEEVKIKVE